MLALRHLSKEYVPGKPVLTDINLEVGGRGVAAVIGPSGTGKSTLIRCINRLVEPTAGEILFDGHDLAKVRGRELRLARRHIGMVFQEYNLVERLTVMENLLTGRLGYVSPWRAWRRKVPRHRRHPTTARSPAPCAGRRDAAASMTTSRPGWCRAWHRPA